MAQKLPWTPWHRVVKLREDVRTGELSLADFAADLHDVMMQRGARPIYEDPAQFFALTYPTFSLRELARDVVLRLAGRNTKAVRQLELTYGGGKTTRWWRCAISRTIRRPCRDCPRWNCLSPTSPWSCHRRASWRLPSTSWMSRRGWRSVGRTGSSVG